ncbi:hypothetical protein [Bacillus sp. T33-2]|uniref:hypothetical protein n=1 Tax=Bacillus sp. T33-2 TaxID=2054168 RepID=UPI000C78CDBC|nr:hypothetical protein [Bacillus sp. T33-2]PLR99282.1 hypothetical protein CVD19_02920 [Bacillus sp. T33-2]
MDLTEGHHESYRVQGTLRGLIIFDCCGYAVIEKEDGSIVAVGYGMEGLGELAQIKLPTEEPR